MKKWQKILLVSLIVLVIAVGITAGVCLNHFIGIPKTVGDTTYSYTENELSVSYGEITLYGKVLIPEGEGPFPTVIYAHGAESDYKADMTTLRSLAKSGIACYTFDFYGWTNRSSGPEGAAWFKNSDQRDYISKILLQVEDLNAVIDYVKTLDFVDTDNLYLLGSSMGGATVATAAVSHSEDIKAIILQYPAINLNPDAMVEGAELDVNGYTGPVLILQGTEDVIVPLTMSQNLTEHYNTLFADHAELIVYGGQPHVFTGTYKVKAAEDIYRFITEMGE